MIELVDQLLANRCESCKDSHLRNADHIDLKWRDTNNGGVWPKPFQRGGIELGKVKAVVVGQDPTIDNSRAIEYVLEADREDRNLGKFLKEVFEMLPDIAFHELYFTNLVKCRFDEKPGRGNRDISIFLGGIAENCVSRFLRRELTLLTNAKYVFTLGRDTYGMVAKSLCIEPMPIATFKNFYGMAQPIPFSTLNRKCHLVALPHQPTYDIAKRYQPYSPEEVRRRLAKISYH